MEELCPSLAIIHHDSSEVSRSDFAVKDWPDGLSIGSLTAVHRVSIWFNLSMAMSNAASAVFAIFVLAVHGEFVSPLQRAVRSGDARSVRQLLETAAGDLGYSYDAEDVCFTWCGVCRWMDVGELRLRGQKLKDLKSAKRSKGSMTKAYSIILYHILFWDWQSKIIQNLQSDRHSLIMSKSI